MIECYLCQASYTDQQMVDEFICSYCKEDTDIAALIHELQEHKIRNRFT